MSGRCSPSPGLRWFHRPRRQTNCPTGAPENCKQCEPGRIGQILSAQGNAKFWAHVHSQPDAERPKVARSGRAREASLHGIKAGEMEVILFGAQREIAARNQGNRTNERAAGNVPTWTKVLMSRKAKKGQRHRLDGGNIQAADERLGADRNRAGIKPVLQAKLDADVLVEIVPGLDSNVGRVAGVIPLVALGKSCR